MRHPPTADLEALIRALVDAGIELIVVGGAAAVIHGAPVATQALDIVPRLGPGDEARLLIEIKQSTGRARDALVVPLLVALRDRSRVDS